MTTTTTQQASPQTREDRDFTLLVSDRCDRCGAQAFVAAAFTKAVLLFCAHHANKFSAKIDAHIICDIRDQLVQDRSKWEAHS